MSVREHDGVLTITLERPGHLDALTAEMADTLAEEVERASPVFGGE